MIDEEGKGEEPVPTPVNVPKQESVANKRPPMNEVPASQRHSGLATPPNTPPGRTPSRAGGKDIGAELPIVELEVPAVPSRSPNPGSTPPLSSGAVVAQQIQAQESEKKAPIVQSVPSSGKRASPSPSRPISPNNGLQEDTTPPVCIRPCNFFSDFADGMPVLATAELERDYHPRHKLARATLA